MNSVYGDKWKREPVILRPGEHPMTEESLPLEVSWILNRLRWNGYLAYVVGGGVRDLLLGQRPKDFDLGTDAPPEKVAKLFRNSRIIGRRFRIVHIYFRDGHVIEVSTFRAARQAPAVRRAHSGPLIDDNAFGPPSEDAWRRDLTINGLFYDSATGEVIDYVGGLEDLNARIVRMIGVPHRRFEEDPVRMVRALRHAARHHLEIELETWRAIKRCAKDIKLCAASRIFEEFLRELRGGLSVRSLRLMWESGLLEGWVPSLVQWLEREVPQYPRSYARRFGPYVSSEWGTPAAFWSLLQVVDAHINNGQTLDDVVLLAAMFTPIGWSHVLEHVRTGVSTRALWKKAIEGPIRAIAEEIPLRAYYLDAVRQILQTYWRLQLYPLQPGLRESLRESPWLEEAIQLMELELQAHRVHFPSWLSDFKE